MLKKTLLAVVGMTLALGAFAAPVSAQPDAVVFHLNGMPSMKLDICRGNTEVASWLKYAANPDAVKRNGAFPAGTYTIKVKQAGPGKCKGKLLAKRQVTFEAGKNYTLVFWKPFSKVLIKRFENDLQLNQPGSTMVTFHHVARYPRGIDIWLWEHVRLAADPFDPTIANLRRGRQSGRSEVRDGQFLADIFPAHNTNRFAYEGFWGWTPGGEVVGIYLIGTKERNYDAVGIFQDGVN